MNEGNQNAKNPMDKKTLIIIGVALLFVVVIALVFIIKPNGGSSNKPVEEKITLVGTEIDGNKLLITATNTKKATYDLEFNVIFYDEANQQVKEYQESILVVEPNQESYHTIDISDVIGKKHEIKVTKETEIPADRLFSEGFEITQSVVTEQYLDVEFVNNSGKAVDNVQVSALFYKDGKVINFTSQYVKNLQAGDKRREAVMIPTNENGEVIRFDSHKVMLKAYNNAN